MYACRGVCANLTENGALGYFCGHTHKLRRELLHMVSSIKLAASGTEDGQQRALLNEVALKIRPHFPLVDLIFHVPNGGNRGGDAKSRAIEGAKMNALGLKKGTPDLCLPIPLQGYGALYIEMKKPKDGALSKDQMNRITMLSQACNFCAIIDDWAVGYVLIYDYIYTSDQAAFRRKYALKEIAPKISVFDPSGYFKVG